MIYGIADLHFDYTEEKHMGIFGKNWKNHENKIKENWKKLVKEDDLVLIPGDISWALKEEEAFYDLKRINKLPGKKVLIKGNHDYWWNSLTKLNNMNLESMVFLQNTSYIHEDIAIVGTRGWGDIEVSQKIRDENMDHNEKIYKRELHRLKLSLDSIDKPVGKIIAMIHYPPFNLDLEPNCFGELMEEYGVDICVYGHLHGDGHKFAKEGIINGIEYICLAADYIDFDPKKII